MTTCNFFIDETSPSIQSLPADLQKMYMEQAAKFGVAHGLKSRKGEPPKFRVSTPGTRGTTGRTNTAKEYADRWKDMFIYFCRIGCWQSALLCDRTNCPNSPLPMVPASLCSYIMYMFGKLDVRVTDYQNDTPMSDIFKKPLMCVGKWKSPNNCKKCSSAVSALHDLYDNLRGPYRYVCQDCLEMTEYHKKDRPYTGCSVHNSEPRIRASENITHDPDVKKCMDEWRANHADYKPKGNLQLSPQEVRQLHDLLITAGFNDLANLQLYVMILIGIRFFLRASEILNMKVDDFLSEFNLANEQGGVCALVAAIKGKTDPRPVKLAMFLLEDPAFEKFNLIPFLLIYVKLAGLKNNSYLFPDLTSRTLDGTYSKSYQYSDFLKQIKRLVVDCFGREEQDCIFGTHVLRKTGYLFAVWGVLGP